MSCSAFGCTNRAGKKIPGVTFHKFPKNETLRKAWIIAVRRKNWSPTYCSTICSDHFEEFDFDRCSAFRVALKQNVVPSIFKAFPKHPQKTSKTNKGTADMDELDPSRSVNDFPQIKIEIDDDDESVLKQLPDLGIVSDDTEVALSSVTQYDVLPVVESSCILPAMPPTISHMATTNILPSVFSSNSSTLSTDITATVASDIPSTKPVQNTEKKTKPVVIRNKFSTFLDFVAMKLHNINYPNMQQLAQIKIANILDEIESQSKEQQSLGFGATNSSQSYLINEIEKKQGNKICLANHISNSTHVIPTNEIGKHGYRSLKCGVFISNEANLTKEIEKQGNEKSSVSVSRQEVETNEIKKNDSQTNLIFDCKINFNEVNLRTGVEKSCSNKSLPFSVSNFSQAISTKEIKNQSNTECLTSVVFSSNQLKLSSDVEKQGHKDRLACSVFNSTNEIEKQGNQKTLTLGVSNCSQGNTLSTVPFLILFRTKDGVPTGEPLFLRKK